MAEATACAGANGGKVGDGEETDVDERSHMAGSRCCKGRRALVLDRELAPTTAMRRGPPRARVAGVASAVSGNGSQGGYDE